MCRGRRSEASRLLGTSLSAVSKASRVYARQGNRVAYPTNTGAPPRLDHRLVVRTTAVTLSLRRLLVAAVQGEIRSAPGM